MPTEHNPAQAMCYQVKASVFSAIADKIPQYRLQFEAANDAQFTDLIFSTPPVKLTLGALPESRYQRFLLFSPMLVAQQFYNYTVFANGQFCVLICYGKLDLDTDRLVQLENINTRYILN